ncbi:MAG: ABC transporter ATP-binding protein [Candidatus Omnitrophota bacterium]|jgi:cobalt/nickel transport system ATP-binding protein
MISDRRVIQIEDLSYVYPDGNKVLQGINLDVFQGETLGVIGPNGAGKTTLLLHFNGLLNGNDATRVRVLSLDINKQNLQEIRKVVGFVFQDPQDQLFMPTVYEDVNFGPTNLGWDKDKVRESTHQALEEVTLLDKASHLSHHLSLGEKKRVSIATVLSMKPEILVLDEPSANLDPAARRHLIDLLKRLSVTKIIAGHDLELILELCNRVVVLDRGMIVADGETREVLSNPLLMQQHNLEVPLSLK